MYKKNNKFSSKKIAIVGCGNMGSRHLQAIAKLQTNLKIQVIEPNINAQKIAKNRVKEVLKSSPKKYETKIEWFNDISGIDKDVDLTIVATTAEGRDKLIHRLLELGHKRFLIEKIVCQSDKKYKSLLKIFERNNAKGWVNCTRRYFPLYSKLISILKGEQRIIFNINAGNLGLGCNVIHFLDLFAAITGNNRDIKLDGQYLFPRLLLNKREKKLLEFAGTITAKTNQGDFASFSFSPYGLMLPIINIATKNIKVFVDEGSKKVLLAKRQNNWRWQKFYLKELYTSNLTTVIANSILKNDTCYLPTLHDSYFLHKELFRIFNKHIGLVTGKKTIICPIT